MASQIGAENLRINAEDARARLESGDPLTVLDARGERAYAESNVKLPGAVRVDQEDFHIDPSWPKDRFTLVYSADLHDATSAMVAQQLVDDGFLDVHVLRGGIEAWRGAGCPTEPK